MKQTRSKRKSPFFMIFVVGVLTVGSSILSNLTPRLHFSSTTILALHYAWILLLLLAITLIFLNFLRYRQAVAEAQKDIQRQRLIETVKAFWITGLLARSLHGSEIIMPDLYIESGVLSTRDRGTSTQNNKKRPLPTHIIQVYDDSFGKLLLLGAPGTGKTTLLLELVRTLLDRVHHDADHPIPVVFNLAHWTKKHQAITTWMVEELHNEYQIPRKLGRFWVSTNQVLPFLDNLDEVPLQYHQECIFALNSYLDVHFAERRMVVCCQSNQYYFYEALLHRSNTVTLQAFMPKQVGDYLSSAAQSLAPLYSNMHENPILRELSHSPQNLSMLSRVHPGKLALEISNTGSLAELQRQISKVYVESMLQQHQEKVYLPRQTMHWLSWLAKQLSRQKRTSFCIEEMYSNWPVNGFFRFFHFFLAYLICGLLGGLTTGFSGVIVCFFILLFFWRNAKVKFMPLNDVVQLETDIWQNLSFAVIGGMIVGIFAGLMSLFIFWQTSSLTVGLLSGLMLGLASGLGGGIIGGGTILVGTALSGEMLQKYSPARPRSSLWLYAINSVLIGIFGGLLFTLLGSIIFSIVWAILAGLVGAAIQGWQGLFIWSSDAFTSTISFLLGSPDRVKYLWFISGVYLWLRNGGKTFIRLFVLHVFFCVAGNIPWNYSRFLAYAVDCQILHKVGKEYVFAYYPLLDYFASL